MKLCLYNPLVSQTTERAAEISCEFRDCAIVILPGTCRRSPPDHPVSTRSLPCHREYSWGWRRQIDCKAGVSILISNHLARPSIVRNVLIPPPALQGRVAGLRLRASALDVLVLGFYVPPRMTMARHRALGKEISRWIADQIAAAGTRTLPLVAGDLNDGLGLVRGSTGRWQAAELCGQFGQKEQGAGTAFREALAQQFMQPCMTMSPVAPTYYSHHGTGSWIDHWFVPTNKHHSIMALQRSHTRLQTITSSSPRDHCPLRLTIDTVVWHPPPAENKKQNCLNRDLIMKAYLSRQQRAPFVAAVEASMMKDGWYEEWRGQHNETNPDSCWRNLVQTITEVATEFFPPETKKEDEYVELARERRQLLKERAQHRQDLRGASEDKAAGLELELTMITRRARKMRQAAAKKTGKTD